MEKPDDGDALALQEIECELFGEFAASFGLHARRISEQFSGNH
jgi:hypothetical protein